MTQPMYPPHGGPAPAGPNQAPRNNNAPNTPMVVGGLVGMDVVAVHALREGHQARTESTEGGNTVVGSNNYLLRTEAVVKDGEVQSLSTMPAPELGFIGLGLLANAAILRGSRAFSRRRG